MASVPKKGTKGKKPAVPKKTAVPDYSDKTVDAEIAAAIAQGVKDETEPGPKLYEAVPEDTMPEVIDDWWVPDAK